MQNFFDKWQPVFEIVARLLGKGWRVNLLDDCQYRIKLTTPELKRYALTVWEEKGRLVIHGFVESRQWQGNGAWCTVSPSRGATGIADDIRRKILTTAQENVKKAQEAEQAQRDAQEQEKIIKGMLSQLVTLDNWHNQRLRTVCAGFKCGAIDKINGGDKTVMKVNSFRKGNFTYYLNYDENEKRYSYVVYVKIRSNKRKAELKSSRVKDIDISFHHIDDPALKCLSDENIKMIKSLIMEIEK